jgi:hypothetical protein
MEIWVQVLFSVCIPYIYMLDHALILLFAYRIRCVARTQGKASFDDEEPHPWLGNLATHTCQKHPDKVDAIDVDATNTPPKHPYTASSAKLMESFLAARKLNPRTDPTKKRFLLHFAAWILEDNLPFTTGESPGINRLFKYLQVKFQLPSDTSVRNELARIYIQLHRTIVKELSVHARIDSRFSIL